MNAYLVTCRNPLKTYCIIEILAFSAVNSKDLYIRKVFPAFSKNGFLRHPGQPLCLFHHFNRKALLNIVSEQLQILVFSPYPSLDHDIEKRDTARCTSLTEKYVDFLIKCGFISLEADILYGINPIFLFTVRDIRGI